MDMTTMAVASNAIAMANQASQLSGSTETSTIDFQSLLASMTGGDEAATDASSVLGLSSQDIQTSMLLGAMGILNQSQRPVVTDPELAALLSKMGNLTGLEDAELEQLLEQMKNRLKKLSEESGQLAAGQQAVAMLAGMMYQMSGIEPDSGTLSVLNNNSGSVLTTMQSGDATEIMKLVADVQTQSATSAATQQLSGMNDISSMLGEGSDNTAMLALATAQANANAKLQAAQTQSQDQKTGQAVEAKVTTGEQAAAQPAAAGGITFEAAVRTAKQQLSDHVELGASKPAATTDTDDGLDIDALQERVDSGVYLRNTALAPQVQQPLTTEAEQPLPAPEFQLTQAVDQALKAGEEQLTVKLNPEELGEVTIQLTKSAEGSMQLTIVAQNPETQALLADQIDAMRVVMKPLDVEVGSILSQEQYEMMNQQQDGQSKQNDGRPMHGAAYYGDEPLGVVETAEATDRNTPYAALDTYI
ncbi:flagellar hook-length control protein FliK [Ruminococcaceae bacterium OttesenSCG-928-D13]|nr:flagellar hook-length control protein FliK [Ruminococcaceae bacterium OttesenSCG-928-D13]